MSTGDDLGRVKNAEKIPTVNEQARGAPELIGKRTAVDEKDAEIQRVKALGGKAMRAPQARVDGALARDKQADAGWAGYALPEGYRHDYHEIAGTIQFDQDPSLHAVADPVLGHHEDYSPFFFPELYTKQDAEALLQIVGEDGAFILRPDPQLGNTKCV